MSANDATLAAAPATLPEYLAHWAATRARAIALRHKSLGVWIDWTWVDLLEEVERVAVALDARGFGSLAMRRCFPLACPHGPWRRRSRHADTSSGAVIWAEPAGARQPLDESAEAGPPALARFTPDALGGAAHAPPLRAQPDDTAFRVSESTLSLTHAALIAAARGWLDGDDVRAGDRAFTAEAPTTEAAVVFLAGWLVAGIVLILPEDATTADADRREAQPTIVAASEAAYEKLRQRVADNLPAAGTRLRTVVDAGLTASTRNRARRALGGWLVRRPLRELLGFRRAALALVLDQEPPPVAAQELFAQLGVPLRALTGEPRAELAAPPAPFSRAIDDHAPLFEPALALSASSSAPVGKLT